MATTAERMTTACIVDDWEDIVVDNDNYSVISLPISDEDDDDEDDAATHPPQEQQVTTSSENPIKSSSQTPLDHTTLNNTQSCKSVEEPPTHIDNAAERCGMDLKDAVHEPAAPWSKRSAASMEDLIRIALVMGRASEDGSLGRLSKGNHSFRKLYLRLCRLEIIMWGYLVKYDRAVTPPSLPDGLLSLLETIRSECIKIDTAAASTTGQLSDGKFPATLDLEALGLMHVMECDYIKYTALNKRERTQIPLSDPVHRESTLVYELKHLRNQIVVCLEEIQISSRKNAFHKDDELRLDLSVRGYGRIKSEIVLILSNPYRTLSDISGLGSIPCASSRIENSIFVLRRQCFRERFIDRLTIEALEETLRDLMTTFGLRAFPSNTPI